MPTDPDKMLIADMHFDNTVVGTRIRNVLQKQGVVTLADLLKLSEEELLDMRNFGWISLAELTAKLSSMGLHLRKEVRW